MFARYDAGRETLDDLSRVETMIRAYFNIDDADIVLVSQEHGSKLGFPEFETNVVFWKAEKRYRMKIFSPVSDVSQADLPIIWLLPSLEDNGDIDCC